MSRENVEIVERLVKAANRGDSEWALGVLAEDVVWDVSRSAFPDADVYEGVDGVRDWFRGLADALGDVLQEVEKVRDVDDRVVVLIRLRGRGPTSQIDVEYRFTGALTFRAGKIVRMDRYDDWAEALEAVGLRE